MFCSAQRTQIFKKILVNVEVTTLSQFKESILADQWNNSSAQQFGKHWVILRREPEYGSKASLITRICEKLNCVDNLTMAKYQQ